jgi:AcrR family transcriptional regulator
VAEDSVGVVSGPARPGPLESLSYPGVPVRKSSRDRRATEAELEAAALRLIAREGILGGIRLREVATEAGINRALVYQYYGSRRALIRAALRTIRSSRNRVIEALRSLPFVERRRILFRESVEDPVFARVEALLALDGDDELLVFPTLDAGLRELERDRAAGELDPSLDLSAVHAVSISVQLGYCIFRDNFLAELGMPAEELDRHAEEVLVRMLAGLRPPADGGAAAGHHG